MSRVALSLSQTVCHPRLALLLSITGLAVSGSCGTPAELDVYRPGAASERGDEMDRAPQPERWMAASPASARAVTSRVLPSSAGGPVEAGASTEAWGDDEASGRTEAASPAPASASEADDAATEAGPGSVTRCGGSPDETLDQRFERYRQVVLANTQWLAERGIALTSRVDSAPTVVADMPVMGLNLVIGTGDGYVLGYNGCGEILWAKPIPATVDACPDWGDPSTVRENPAAAIQVKLAVGDMDGDGLLEIFGAASNRNMGRCADDGPGSLFILELNAGDALGRTEPHFSVSPAQFRAISGIPRAFGQSDDVPDPCAASPVLADVDGDGQLEALVSCFDQGFYAIEHDGTLLWRDFMGETHETAPAVADIDLDGRLELALGVGAANNKFNYSNGADFMLYSIPIGGGLFVADAATGLREAAHFEDGFRTFTILGEPFTVFADRDHPFPRYYNRDILGSVVMADLFGGRPGVEMLVANTNYFSDALDDSEVDDIVAAIDSAGTVIYGRDDYALQLPANVLENGSFEDGLSPWYPSTRPHSEVSLVRGLGPGRNAVRLTNDSYTVGNDDYTEICQHLPRLRPSSDYRVELYYTGGFDLVGLHPRGFGMVFYGFDASGARTQTHTDWGYGPAGWTQLLLDLETASDVRSGSLCFRLSSGSRGGGDAAFAMLDEVLMTRRSGPMLAVDTIRRSPRRDPVMADLEHDGRPELIFVLDDRQGYCNVVWNELYNTYEEDCLDTAWGVLTPHSLMVTDAATGAPRPGFPVVLPPRADLRSRYWAYWNEPIVADVDGDGLQEMIVHLGYDLYAIRADGRRMALEELFGQEPPFDLIRAAHGSPAVADLDDDGNFELILTQDGWMGTSGNGLVVLPLQGARSADWSQRRLTQYNNAFVHSDAAFVGSPTMDPPRPGPGEAFTVTARVRNTGTTAWNSDALYRLGIREGSTWGRARVALPERRAVLPGEVARFRFNLTAPATAGRYTLTLQMLQEHVRWFGQTDSRTVRVFAIAD